MTNNKSKRTLRKYSKEEKVQALKLIKEVGLSKASMELGITKSTLSTWQKNAIMGDIDTGAGTQTPKSALTQAQEIKELKMVNKELSKKIKQMEEEREILEDACAFFAQSRQKLKQKNVLNI